MNEFFNWEIRAGDKIPNSEDDIPCGDGWIPNTKECHDGDAHRPEPGANPYWTGPNSAQERQDRGEGWENTKPRTKKEDVPGPAEELEEPQQEPEEEPEPEKPELPSLRVAPGREERALQPEDVEAQVRGFHSVHDQMNTILISMSMAAPAAGWQYTEDGERWGDLQEELKPWKDMLIRDQQSLAEYATKLGEVWGQIQQSSLWPKVKESRGIGNFNFQEQKMPLIERAISHAFNLYEAEKREDDPRDIIKWDTLARKPDMMNFRDIPDLVFRDMPDGPKNGKEAAFMEEKLAKFEGMFLFWRESPLTHGPLLAQALLGKPTAMTASGMIIQSPFLPNPKAAKMILEKSAVAGDEDANDMMWYEFGRAKDWSGRSFLHSISQAAEKAISEVKTLGLDLEDIKTRERALGKLASEMKRWTKSVHDPQRNAAMNKEGQLDQDQRDGKITQEQYNKLWGPIGDDLDKLLNAKVARNKAINEQQHALGTHIEKARNDVLANLEKANEATKISDETFADIANGFAEVRYPDIDPEDDAYKGKKGKTLMLARNIARRKPAEFKNQQQCENVLGHLAGIIHRDLLEPHRDASASAVPRVAWRIEAHQRAFADERNNLIQLDRNSSADTLAHEYGHHLEFHNKRIHQRMLNFLESRTKGKKQTWLGTGYKRDEKQRKGKFFDKYAGKIYDERKHHDAPDNPATELMSMGVQALYNPHYWNSIVTEDPEHLALVLASLRGY